MSIDDRIKKHVGMGVADQRYICAGCRASVSVGRMDALAGSKAISALGWRIVDFKRFFGYCLACPKCTDEQQGIAA